MGAGRAAGELRPRVPFRHEGASDRMSQLLVRRQDDTLGVISGTLHNLASQAGLIGEEVGVQSE